MDLSKITDGFVKTERDTKCVSGPTPEKSPVTPSKECEKRKREDEEEVADTTVPVSPPNTVQATTTTASPSSANSATSSTPLSHFAHLMQKSDTMYRQNLNADQYLYSDEEKENAPAQAQYAFISHSITSYPSNEPAIDNARLARRKRRRTSPTELALLEQEFARNQKPPKHIRVDIARRVDMTEKAVQVWFQNKRQSVRKSINKSMTDDTSFAESSFAETTFDEDSTLANSTLNNTMANRSVSELKSVSSSTSSTSEKLSLTVPSLPPPSTIASVATSVAAKKSFSVFEDPEPKKKPTAPRLSMRGGKATVIYAGKPKVAARRLGAPPTPCSPATGGTGTTLGGSPLATSSPMTQRSASQLNAASSPLAKRGSAEESLAATLKKRLPAMHYDLPVTNKTSSVRENVVDASREAECISNLLSLRNGGRW